MKKRERYSDATFVIGVFSLCLAGCGGAKVLDDPEPLQLLKPLTINSDGSIEAALDWVIVRDGPGTWVRNADWDQYLLTVTNSSDKSIRIDTVHVYDSSGFALTSSGRRDALVKGSRAVAKRYRQDGLKVKAGVGGAAISVAGAATGLAGVGVGVAALGGSSAAVGAAGAAVTAIYLAPAVIVAGAVRSMNNREVAREIVNRHSPLPVYVSPNNQQELTLFFPLAPAPQKVELTYSDSGGEHRVVLRTVEILNGLHLGGGSEE